MAKKDLGLLKEVDLREIFKREDTEFTPWLNSNISRLGDVLGIEIIDTQTEVPVGNFALDILGSLAGTARKVIIENQIDPTDHTHLGQILTYASGVNASVIVWVAKEFREEHISALEWLNDNLKEDVSFFGVEVRAMQIDTSKPALDFEIVVKPNEWERTVKSVKTVSDTNLSYLKFYEKLVDEYAKLVPSWRKRKARPQSWILLTSEKSGVYYGWSFGVRLFRIELYIDTGDKAVNESYFDQLYKNKDKIEKEIKGIMWNKLEDKKACRIEINKPIKDNINKLSEEDKASLVKWGVEYMKKFQEVFSGYVRKL